MARIVVLGSVARDDVIPLEQRLREGAHVQGAVPQARLGGGGANTAIALSHAGHEVSLVAAVGTDPLADELLAELARHGVDIGPVTRVSGPSTHSLVLLDPKGERTIINLSRTRESRPPRRLLDLDADCVYVRSHGQDMEDLLLAKARLCPVIAQIRPLPEGRLPAHVLIGSKSDLGYDVLASPLESGRIQAGDTLRWVVITHGAEGAEAFGVDGQCLRATAPDVEVVDTTGAGDAFAAGLAHALALRLDMSQALPLAVYWGAVKVTRMGSYLDRDSLRTVLKEWTGRSFPSRT